MRVYKLVRVIDGRFYSSWRLEYRPKIGKLFIFADLKSAKTYPVWFERDIFVCEAENAVKADMWPEMWEAFWDESVGDRVMFVYKLVRKIDGRYFSLYGDRFPRLNLEYKIKKVTCPTHGKIFVYPRIDYWPEYKRHCTVLVCRTAKVFAEDVRAYRLEFVEAAVLGGKFAPQSLAYNAALCDYVIPVKELTESEVDTLFRLHGMTNENGFWKYS